MRPSFSPSRFQTVVAILLLAFAFLGTRAIWDPDEGRYTNVALNMVESGDWVHPMRNEYVGHWTKPPLTYWVIAASTATFGYNAWAARIPYGLAFLFCAWMVWLIARRLLPGDENRAALIYATMLLPFGAAQLVTTDFLLAAALSGAMAAWIESRHVEPPHSRHWVMLMWLGFALGFLAKGPPALLPLLVVVACSIWLPAQRANSSFHWSGLLVFAAVALPWFVVVINDTPGLLDYFLHKEVVERVASDDFGRHGEWYGWLQIYAPTLIIGSLPGPGAVALVAQATGSDARLAKRGDTLAGFGRPAAVSMGSPATDRVLPVALTLAIVYITIVHAARLDRRTADPS